MLFARVYPRETQEMVFDAHDRAFTLFKETCGRGIYDNMRPPPIVPTYYLPETIDLKLDLKNRMLYWALLNFGCGRDCEIPFDPGVERRPGCP
jgi:hypothetical protein